MSVLIVGGGMTGATLALAISRLTGGALPVHLIEAQDPHSSRHPGFDDRAIALAAGTCQQLARIGIWQRLAERATPIQRVHVSDRGHAGFVNLAAADYGLSALGQVVELHDVGQRLFGLLREAPGVTLHCPAKVEAVSRSQESVSLTLEGGKIINGKLLVAADGSRSALGARCGISWQQQPYEQLAIIANVSTALPHEGRAFERFTEHGPLAMLPMSQGRCSLVWCHPQSRHDEVLSWSDERFRHELQQAFGWRLGRIVHAGKRSVYPLSLTRASRTVAHRLALVGNAAQTLHPIAGQGFNLGLRDVMSLAAGDQVIIETPEATFTYTLTVAPADLTVAADDSWVLDPVPGHVDVVPTQAFLTLTTAEDLVPTGDRSVGFGTLTKTETP